VSAENLTEEVFREGTEDHPNVFTYGGMIAHVLSFGAHRRSLVIAALAADGVDDLRNGDPMLYFADKP
jgi:AraC family transcriptional regulator